MKTHYTLALSFCRSLAARLLADVGNRGCYMKGLLRSALDREMPNQFKGSPGCGAGARDEYRRARDEVVEEVFEKVLVAKDEKGLF